VYVYVCVRETERQRDRETERQRDRETERQRDRERDRERLCVFEYTSSDSTFCIGMLMRRPIIGEGPKIALFFCKPPAISFFAR